MNLATKVVISVIALGTIEAFLMLWPTSTPSYWQGDWVMFHVPLSITAAYSWLLIGTAVLFLMGLGVYKAKLRHAYTFIVSGVFLNALGAAQMPLVAGFSLWQSWWVTSGIVSLPFVLGSTLLYIGAINVAHLINIKTIFSKVMLVLLAITSLSALSMLLPHIETPTPEILYDAGNAITLWGALTYLAAGLTVVAVRQHAGAHYANALNWLAAGTITGSFVLLLGVLDSLVLDSAPDIWSLTISLLALPASLIFLRAGYLFYKTREY